MIATFCQLTKKEIAAYESISKWLKTKLYPYVLDKETTVTYDGEDPGFVDMEFNLDIQTWDIALVTSCGDKYGIASSFDCCDMTITDVKNDIKERIEVMKLIEWRK